MARLHPAGNLGTVKAVLRRGGRFLIPARNLRVLLPLSAFALVAAACSPDVGGGASTTTTAPPPSQSTTSTTPETTTSVQDVTTTSAPGDIPGDIIDFGPREGDQLMVIGVRHDHVLNLRAAPGTDQEILDGIEAVYLGLIAQGETRALPTAFWVKVDYEGTIGWVHMSYIGYRGDTQVEDVGDLTAASMVELGLGVAQSLGSEDPPSQIVLVVDETVGELGEVTYDVIGLGDDAVRGLRVYVVGEPVSEGFSLVSVEVTSLCGRGVDNGLCT